MEKDLRDAFKALTLVRADLVATRQAKADAERQWRGHAAHLQTRIAQLQEALAMRDEDVRVTQHETTKTLCMGSEHPETEPEREDEGPPGKPVEEPDVSLEEVAKDQIALLTSVYELKTQLQSQSEQLVAQEAQHAQERSEWALLSEAMKRQLADLQETQLDLVREKKFMDEKFEFVSAEVGVVKSERDALRLQLAQRETSAEEDGSATSEPTLSSPSLEAMAIKLREQQDEMKRLVEAHESREASLQQIIQDHATEMETLRRQMAQQQETREQELETRLESQRAEWAKEKQEWTTHIEETTTQCGAQVEELERERKRLQTELHTKQHEIDGLATDRTELVQQLQQIRDQSTEQLLAHSRQEEARMKTQQSEQEKLQHELTTLLASVEAATSENAVKMSSLQRCNDGLQRALVDKTSEVDEAHASAADARERLEQLELVVDLYHHGVKTCREEVSTQREQVVRQQQHMKTEMERAATMLMARCHKEVEDCRRAVADKEQELASAELERHHLERELEHVQDAARTLREQLAAAEKDCEATQQLRADLVACEHERARLAQVVEDEKHKTATAHQHELDSLRAAHEKELEETKMAQISLVQEVGALRAMLERRANDLTLAQAAADQADAKLQYFRNGLRDKSRESERRIQSLELQLMHAEDTRPSVLSAGSWTLLSSQIRVLDDFLPQLQLFADRLQTSLQLCAENARAMHVLSSSSSASSTLLSDLSTLLRLAEQWKQLFSAQGLGTHVRLVRRSVLATLSQWFEEGDEPSGSTASPPPPPPFTIDSQEVAIVLQNWTSDLEKRKRVAQWLAQIATKRGEHQDEDEDQDQATLELKDLTREVKDAFCMLIVPLLQQNRAVSVRAFTRRVCDIKSSYSPEETCWEMRIHVQFAPRHPSSHPAPWTPRSLRRIPSTSSVSSVGSTTSSLSLSSISSASKLQIIHARLQQMQQQSPLS